MAIRHLQNIDQSARTIDPSGRQFAPTLSFLPTSCFTGVALGVLLLLGILPGAQAQHPMPAPAQTKSILVTGGTVHVGDGRTIDEGAVGLRAGVIDYVGYAYGVKAAYDTIIDVRGQQVYPGLIAADATLGLQEIEAVRASVDDEDVGSLEPELRSLVAYKADSRLIPTVRTNGVLMAQVVPRGLVISGTSSIVQLDAWDWEQAALRTDDAVHLNWPAAYQRSGWWAEPGETDQEKKDQRAVKLDELRTFFRSARAYAQVSAPLKRDLRMEAMRGVFDGTKALFVHADAAKEITEAVQFAKAEGVERTVIVGGYDAWRVADLLRENKVDVVLRRLHSLPMRPEDDVDLVYRLPALLKERGVRFCLGYAGDMEAMGLRNLPFVAGAAAAYGLSAEDALRSITLDAAAVLGIDDRTGSLSVGKQATLIVSKGDVLDMRGNALTHAFIQGRRIVLDDHHQQQYRLYKERQERGQ
jgi:imidazolonepropionase-like amidohydrolase